MYFLKQDWIRKVNKKKAGKLIFLEIILQYSIFLASNGKRQKAEEYVAELSQEAKG
jgi:hypothetical protein